jgi:hypothetical protein
MADLVVGVNTYVTLDQADQYVTDNYPSISPEYTSWFDQNDDDKQAMLVQSANSLNNIKYTGGKAIAGQPLAFPRAKRFGLGPTMITTLFVSQYNDNSLSDRVGGDNGLKAAGNAQVENAVAYFGLAKTVVTKTRERRLSGQTSEKVGSVSKTYSIRTEDVADAENGIYTKKVNAILRAWITETVYSL